MYAIIDKKVQFVAMGKEHYYLVEKAVFGEMGWEVKTTKDIAKAKRYKTYNGAYRLASQMGMDYEVVQL